MYDIMIFQKPQEARKSSWLGLTMVPSIGIINEGSGISSDVVKQIQTLSDGIQIWVFYIPGE